MEIDTPEQVPTKPLVPADELPIANGNGYKDSIEVAHYAQQQEQLEEQHEPMRQQPPLPPSQSRYTKQFSFSYSKDILDGLDKAINTPSKEKENKTWPTMPMFDSRNRRQKQLEPAMKSTLTMTPRAMPTPPPATSLAQDPYTYTHQFSFTSCRAILDGLGRAGKREERDVKEEKSRTMPMPIPKGKERKRTKKRNRDVDADPDATESETEDTVMQSPGASSDDLAEAVCIVCDRPSNPLLSPLVPCRRCGQKWHRLCHSPVIADHVAAAAGLWETTTTEATEAPAEEGNEATEASAEGGQNTTGATVEGGQRSTWECSACTAITAAEREEARARRVCAIQPASNLSLPTPPSPPTHHDLSGQTPQQRRMYLRSLPRLALEDWLQFCMDQYPELAVYPPPEPEPEEQEVPAEVEVQARPASSSGSVIAALPGPARRGRPPRTGWLPTVPGQGYSGQPALASAVMGAVQHNRSYRYAVMNSLKKQFLVVSRQKEELERAADIAAGKQVKPRRGRPPKIRLPAASLLPPPPPKTQYVSPPISPASAPPAPQSPSPSPPPSPSQMPNFEPTPVDAEEEDPTGLMENWPKPGEGLYARLGPDWEGAEATMAATNGEGVGGNSNEKDANMTGDVLVDKADFTSFSSVVFNEQGRKVMENGQPVLLV